MKSSELTIGILAHVDAGKTTLTESILYLTGQIKKPGRVDHKDAFLDTFDLEKDRGITIFSKQATFPLRDYNITLLDTPGHVDFSAEMERTLRVLDYAVLVINGSDGVQGHTLTVWRLLKRYRVPVFIFVNKMDLAGTDRHQLLSALQKRVDDRCVNFNQMDEHQLYDDLALCDETLMEAFLANERIDDSEIAEAVARRHLFPVYFGSALKMKGVQEFLDALAVYMKTQSYPDVFGARVFKISRDRQGNRLTYVKVTGGELKVKTMLNGTVTRTRSAISDGVGSGPSMTDAGDQEWQEKVNQIRIYSGDGHKAVQQAPAGVVCALTGLNETRPGDGLGFESHADESVLTPVLNYRVLLPDDSNVYTMLNNLRLLEEEDPLLNVIWNELLSEIHIQVMGEIQLEILASTVRERFGVIVTFDKGNLVYRETIKETVIGMGHFEPLKHYAEVHLLMEPIDNGQGMQFGTDCSEDVMDRNWQRLVLTHLQERQHHGVLTGSVLTDMKITLVAGRGHNKHTEGGDFRQATFRALRHGLMRTESVLLEPVYSFALELPKELIGRAISDVERMQGRYEDPVIEDDYAVLTGTAPVASMMHYSKEVIAYTRGMGKLSLDLKGYEPCHNPDEVIETIGYDPDKDLANPAGSVFCSKGSGYGVPWQEAESHMHVASGIRLESEGGNVSVEDSDYKADYRERASYTDKELEAIFVKTYGESKRQLPGARSKNYTRPKKRTELADYEPGKRKAKTGNGDKYLLVDGYNIIFAWDDLKELAEDSLDGARQRLMDILCSYQGQIGSTVILVFDAYRVAGNRGDMETYHNIHVVYTKEAETADQYIEKLVYKISSQNDVTVATSDVLEQVIILGKGAKRLSAEGLEAEIKVLKKDNSELMEDSGDNKFRPIGDAIRKSEMSD